ncbi:hypothetical protein HT585_13110 [Ensifer sp. HO-A22]|uniref:RkpR, polysaccharide export protein n=1 Tax=Ensifer oleiphilus TaxID=2742698 RepID=A0A7Y6Q699_9HYPH|nr:hypothetical protein [Ensifer oleiphilus]NVD39800.1 hypothetical protein [Ensifer oleiphilus]
MASVAEKTNTAMSEGAAQTANAISIELRRAARKARTPRPVTSGGGGFRARQSDRYFYALIALNFVLFFALPVSLATIYYGFVAANQYVSEARFAVRAGQDMSIAGLSKMSGISALVDTGQARDGLIIADYVESRALVDVLSPQFDLPGIFSKAGADLIASFDPSDSIEDFVDYWKDQVDISVDRNSGLISIKLRAFTAEDSLALTEAVVKASERMVNKLTRRNETDSLVRAEEEVETKKGQLSKAVSELRDARNKAGVLDIETAATGYSELITELRLELSKLETVISTTATDAPQLASLTSRASSLRAQIESYEGAIAGGGRSTSVQGSNLAELATGIQQKDTEVSIARSEYASAVAAYEQARLTLERQRSYLLTYIEPQLAEEALYPRRFLMWISVFGTSLLISATVAGLSIVVRDHMAS